MQRVNRLRFFIIASIACAILFCVAAFSVSWASWSGDEGSTAKIDAKSGLFYVEYPQYSETEEVKLNANKYYLQVKQTDNSGAVTGYAYYSMSDKGTADDGRQQYNVKLGLDEGQSAYLYKGNTAIIDVQKDSNWTENGTLSNGKFTATSGGVFDFYFKEGSDEGSTEVTYPYTVKLELTCSGNKTYSMYFNIPEVNLSKVYLWLWSASTNYSGGKWPGVSFAEIKSKNYSSVVNKSNLFKVSGVKAENLSFIISYNDTDPRPSSGNPAKQTSTLKFSNVFSEGDNYKTITASSSSITITDTPATGGETTPTTNALYVGYSASGTATPPTPIVQATSTAHPKLDVRANKTTIEKNADGRFVYRNYICVSRKNHVGDDDNSMAYVELSLDECNVNPYNIIVKSLNITRKATNANGVPNGGIIEPAPRIYNYDPTVETRLGPDPILHTQPDPNGDENRYPILTHGNKHDVSEGLDGEAADNHMQDHYDDGAYIVLFFADRDQQYFALDIEIELELDKDNIENAESINTLELTLKATANNINEWQRYEDGWGQPWGFYMGGLINDVWLWDPRRTTQMEVASGSVKLDDPSTYKTINYSDGKGDVEYPAGLIDLSLTVNLIKGSTVKMYMIDNEGHRLNGNTIYLMPHAIEYDTETKKLFVDNPDYPIYDEDLNIVIPKTGSYMFRLVGHVRKGDETLDGMSGDWFRLQDGECLKSSEVNAGDGGNGTDKETGSACKNLPAYNLIVDRLYITSSEGKSTCEITLDANGGKFGDGDNATTTTKKSVMFGSNVNVNKLPKPTYAGKSFVGWYTDAACTTAFANNTPATSDITLYAKWEGERFTITFDGNGGKWGTATTKEVKTGTDGKIASADLLVLGEPEWSGYSFKGWWTATSGGEEVTINANIVFGGTQTLYAHWIPQHTVTFNAGDGSWSGGIKTKPQKVDDGDTVDEPSVANRPNPQSDKYVFDYWYKDGTDTAFDFANTTITSDITLYAKWKQVRFDIKFMMNDGSDTEHDTLITDNTGHLTAHPANPTRDGFDFVDWYTTDVEADQTDSTKVTIGASGTKFTADSSVYAKWAVATATKYTVTFNNNYGSAGVYKTEKVEEGNTVAEPANPTRSGYTFRGWYEDAACSMLKDYDFAKAVNSNITLYAKWTTSTMSNTYYLVGQINSWTAQPEYYIGSSGDVVITIATANNNNERFKIAQRNGSNSNFTNWKGASDITVGSEYNGGGDDIVLKKAGKYTIHFDGSKIQIYYYENGSYGGGGGGDEFNRENLIAIEFSDGTIYLDVSGLRSTPNKIYMWSNITAGFPGDDVTVGGTKKYLSTSMGSVAGMILCDNNDNLSKDINPGSGNFDSLEAGAVYEVKEEYFKKIGTIDDEGGGEGGGDEIDVSGAKDSAVSISTINNTPWLVGTAISGGGWDNGINLPTNTAVIVKITNSSGWLKIRTTNGDSSGSNEIANDDDTKAAIEQADGNYKVKEGNGYYEFTWTGSVLKAKFLKSA